MPGTDRDFVVRAARIGIVAAVSAAVLLALLWLLKAALTPLAAAFVIAYLLDPIIDRFEARRLQRSVAILVLLLLFGGGGVALLFFLIPMLRREVAELGARLPGYLERVQTELLPWLSQKLGVELPDTLTELLAQLRSGDVPLPLDAIGNLLAGAAGTLTGTLSALVGLMVVPILAYYLLVEFDAIVQRAGQWIPPRHRDYVVGKARKVDELVSRFLRGQLLIAACLGLLYAVGFSVIGIDLAVGVGLVSGALALVPYLGNAVAVLLASALAILEFGFDWHLAAALGWYAVVQNLEGFVLTPRIVGSSVGLHPAVVILALLIGGDLFGFLGLMVAVPAAAVIKVFVEELGAMYRESTLFDEPQREAGSEGD